MAVKKDEYDLLDVFTIQNLSNMAQFSPFVEFPLGFQNFIDTLTFDNVMLLPFPSDVREILVNYILTRQIAARIRNRQMQRRGVVENFPFSI